jgi:hypothetical protein
MAYKTADQSSSDGTNLVDVTDLTWPIVATGIYVVEVNLLIDSAATTTGPVFALNGPAAADLVQVQVFGPRATTTSLMAQASAFDGAMTITDVPSTNFPYWYLMNAFVDNGANSGTLAVRFRSEVDTSAVTIWRGSWGRLTRVG